MRSLWTGTLSFGLVNIPVKVFSAVQESSLNLDMLDSKDHSNIKFKRVNESTGREVSYENIVKGYMYHNKYVVLDPEDFKAADAKKTQVIDIINFTDETEVDSIYYEQPYYLEPAKGGERAYAILRDPLATSGKVGLGSFVMRNKEILAIVKPYKKVIVLNRIRFEEEIRDFNDLKLPEVSKGKSKELEMANMLIKQLTVKFDIKKFKDTYTNKLLNIIHQKAKSGKKYKAPKLKVSYKQPQDDLMATLKASLGGRRKAS